MRTQLIKLIKFFSQTLRNFFIWGLWTFVGFGGLSFIGVSTDFMVTVQAQEVPSHTTAPSLKKILNLVLTALAFWSQGAIVQGTSVVAPCQQKSSDSDVQTHSYFPTALSSSSQLFLPAPAPSIEDSIFDVSPFFFGSGDHPLFRQSPQVLFLAEGPSASWVQMAQKVAQTFPNITVVRSDYAFSKSPAVRGNLQTYHVDHQGRFLFPANKFDSIVMNRGLCFCHSKKVTCGGIHNNVKSASWFIGEVVRVLNRKNPKARAYLEGGVGQTDKTLSMWQTAILKVMRRNPDVQINIIKYKGVLRAIEIIPKVGIIKKKSDVPSSRLKFDRKKPYKEKRNFSN